MLVAGNFLCTYFAKQRCGVSRMAWSDAISATLHCTAISPVTLINLSISLPYLSHSHALTRAFRNFTCHSTQWWTPTPGVTAIRTSLSSLLPAPKTPSSRFALAALEGRPPGSRSLGLRVGLSHSEVTQWLMLLSRDVESDRIPGNHGFQIRKK